METKKLDLLQILRQSPEFVEWEKTPGKEDSFLMLYYNKGLIDLNYSGDEKDLMICCFNILEEFVLSGSPYPIATANYFCEQFKEHIKKAVNSKEEIKK